MRRNHISLKYAQQCLELSCNGARVLRPELGPPPEASETLIDRALDAPLGTPALEQIVRPGEKVLIVTSDITRYTASELYLPRIVQRLSRAGIRDEDMEILIALGIHRKQSDQEHQRILGPLYGRIRVTDHDCDDPKELRHLGTTPAGIDVLINRRALEADRLIVTGTAGFHYFAGFGGGRKGLIPGIAGRQTCMDTHFSVFNPPEQGGKHPLATAGVLEGNPVHENLLAAARMLQPDFLLNTVLSPSKGILGVYCGELEAAHLAACDQIRTLYAAPLEAPADLALVSCGGHPKDINFIQAHKALDYGVRALKPGGTLILLAACPDGFGNATFIDWFRHRDLETFEAALRQDYEINGQTAYATLDKALRFDLILISELSRQQTEAMGMRKALDLKEALAMADDRLPQNPVRLIIPDGGSVLPGLKN